MSIQDEMKRVADLLGIWVGQIRTNNAIEFYDINQVAENVAAKLLNLTYNLQLKNLNDEQKHFPGIDLGDDIHKIAYQITSRNDPAKIEKDLTTFVEKHLTRFPNGIRFLILNNEKPQLTGKKRDEYATLCPFFVPDRDILTDKDLTVAIEKIYHDDNERFLEILKYLEVEFGGGGTRNCLKTLIEKSKEYYHKLRGPNGRFKNLKISDLILPPTETKWLPTKSVIEGATKRSPTNVLDTLPLLWQNEIKHAVILGDGGMGKKFFPHHMISQSKSGTPSLAIVLLDMIGKMITQFLDIRQPPMISNL